MNFGLQLAAGRVGGVDSTSARSTAARARVAGGGARIYAALLLPERDSKSTVERLAPLVRDPELGGRVERAAAEVAVAEPRRGRSR